MLDKPKIPDLEQIRNETTTRQMYDVMHHQARENENTLPAGDSRIGEGKKELLLDGRRNAAAYENRGKSFVDWWLSLTDKQRGNADFRSVYKDGWKKGLPKPESSKKKGANPLKQTLGRPPDAQVNIEAIARSKGEIASVQDLLQQIKRQDQALKKKPRQL